jgi:hypothetical protein
MFGCTFCKTRYLLATLMASAVCLVAGARYTEASCGDYVKMGRHTADAGQSTGSHAASPAKSAEEKAPYRPQIPSCTGPHCANDSVPPTVPETDFNSRFEQWAVITDAGTSPALALSSANLRSGLFAVDGHPLGILRPPRVVA